MKRILLVEDSEDLKLVLVDEIERWFPSEIVTASSANEALKVLKTDRRFDLVITDFCMPNGTGKDLFEMMNANQIEIPTLLFSSGVFGSYMQEDFDSCKQYGNFVDFIEKPDFKKLKAKAESVFADNWREDKKNLPKHFDRS
ncbi:MAG: response regulator [Bdellovibrionales bacterium]